MDDKVIIVDDEAMARETLANLLLMEFPQINIAAKCASVEEGLKAINEHQPNLVFLDIEMPSGTAFDLLKKTDNKNFNVIFVTAYSEYAINAIKFSALDYLLKPVDIDELKSAVNQHISAKKLQRNQLELLVEMLQEKEDKKTKIAIPESDGISIIEIDHIIRCESDGNYTKIFTADGNRIITSKTLAEYDDMLSGLQFFRVHRSHLINMNYVVKYVKADGGYLIMKDNAEVEISRRKKAEFIEQLAALS